MASYGFTFSAGDTVTPTRLNSARTVSDIVNADVSATAAIAATKLADTLDLSAKTVTLPAASVAISNLSAPQYTGFRNRIINGDFRVAQRGASFTSTGGANNDDTYNLDRWYVLSDGNDSVDITQTTSEVPTGGYAAIALDVETVNKKFGIAQIIEQQNCIGLIGGNVTLSFKAKVSSTTKLDNVKAAIVAWSGTADTVTSDIVSAWGAEGTNPTLIANATYENTPANLNVTTSYATYTLTANVDTASTKNIVVFIWSDVTDTTLGDFIYVSDVQLEAGSVSTPLEFRPISQEIVLCQRYYEVSNGNRTQFSGNVTSGQSYDANVGFKVEKRVAPNVVLTNAADDAFPSTVGGTTVGTGGFYENRTADATARGNYRSNWTADAEL